MNIFNMIGLMYSISAMTTADIFHREASILMHLEATFRFCFNICMCVYVFITYLYTFLNLFFCCIIICHMTLNMIDVICLGLIQHHLLRRNLIICMVSCHLNIQIHHHQWYEHGLGEKG
jgi:hypothetical protein